MLEDFHGKDYAFVTNWLRGKGLDSGYEYMNVLSSVYNEIQIYLYQRFK